MALNKASEASAADWQTHVKNYLNFSRMVVWFFSVVEILLKHFSLCTKSVLLTAATSSLSHSTIKILFKIGILQNLFICIVFDPPIYDLEAYMQLKVKFFIVVTKLLNFDWSRAVQLIPNNYCTP